MNSFPFHVAVIKYAQYFQHNERNSPGATNGQIGPENREVTTNISVSF